MVDLNDDKNRNSNQAVVWNRPRNLGRSHTLTFCGKKLVSRQEKIYIPSL
jgi:hypothetical protein